MTIEENINKIPLIVGESFQAKSDNKAELKDSDGEASVLEEQRAEKKGVEEGLAKTRGALEDIRRAQEVRKYLIAYLDLKDNQVEQIKLEKVKNSPSVYKKQYEFLDDKRLENVTIALVPDDLWVKGSQPSESHADEQLILFKKSYYEKSENTDEIAWMCHELAHCQSFLDSDSSEKYQEDMKIFAFADLPAEYSYPNNLVEKTTFAKQFQYLKKQGKGREEILEMIKKYYEEKDLPFFNKLLSEIYG